MASKYSFKPLVTFSTIEIKNGHFMASGFGIYSWESQKHIDDFHIEESWPALKATRPQYWKNLRSVHIDIDKDMELIFKKNKVYRITYIWLYDFKNAEDNLAELFNSYEKSNHRFGWSDGS